MIQALIMAGGKGTRLRSITGDELPKPMAPVAGKPILQWQIENLRDNGIQKVILVIGYLGDVIRNYFGNGSAFGVDITYFAEEAPLGTAGALPLLMDRLEDHFLLVFGDVIFDVDLDRMERFHLTHNSEATLLVHPNTHPFDSDIVMREEDGRVINFNSKHDVRTGWYDNCVNAGFYILSRTFCERIQGKGVKSDLEKDVLLPFACSGGAVYAYATSEYIKDVGTPERIAKAETELKTGFVARRCLKNKQKCIFLDRDGTINQYRGLVWNADQFELEECAIEAVQTINDSGYLAIVITNQPVVSRGMCQIEDVINIHNKMKTLLGQKGAYLDDVLFCPHHPDKGYPEENPVYKISCHCRKPDIGMIETCVQKFNIDLSGSWMVGDSTVDIRTGINAGCHTALVKTGIAGTDGKYEDKPEIIGKDLLDAVRQIVKRF